MSNKAITVATLDLEMQLGLGEECEESREEIQVTLEYIWTKAAEQMRERAAKEAASHGCPVDHGPFDRDCGDVIADAIRALPLEEHTP